MSPISLEILIVLVLVFANGLFTMSEMAIISARKARLQQLANQGSVNARVALQLAESPNHFLSSVQIGITLLAILSGAFAESTIARRLAPVLSLIPGVLAYKDAIASVLAVLITTYLTLIIGELVPKRLALNNPEQIATSVAIPMRVLTMITSPAAYFLSASTDFVLRILGIVPSSTPQVTEEEIKILIEQGTEAGMFEEAEQDMVERVFRLGDRPVSALMTPRPDIVWLELEDTATENRKKMIDGAYSRYPVCQGGLDNVLGIMHVTDLLTRSLAGEPLDFTISLRPPVFVPESTRGLKVLEMFKQIGTHMALVVDEYGVIQGLVTLNDVMIEIVGDVPSADQQGEPQAVQREDGSWLLDGMLSIDEFFEIFEIEELPGEHRGNYQTLGGLVITHLGRIPAPGDRFDWEWLRFEVLDMDGNRVDKVLVIPGGGSSPRRRRHEQN